MRSLIPVLLTLGLIFIPGQILFIADGSYTIYQASNDDENSGGGCCSSCCCGFIFMGIWALIFGLLVTSPIWVSAIVILLLVLVTIALIIFVFRYIFMDVKKNELGDPLLYAILVTITFPIGLLIYLIYRNQKKK